MSILVISREIDRLKTEREQLINYMKAKIEGGEDWHAVSDAANDLREIDCKIALLNNLDDYRA